MLARVTSRRPNEASQVDDKEAGVTLTFLKSERAIDYLRWSAAFVAVVLTYGVAAWMLRPTNWQLDVNAPVVEINLPDMPELAAIPPTDRGPGSPGGTKPPGTDAPGALPRPAADQRDVAPEPVPGGAAINWNEGGAAAAKDAKDGAADAEEKAAATDKPDDKLASTPPPGSPAEKASETPPRTEATDSGGGGRPLAAPPRVVTPDNSTAASVAHAPIDTSITVNQGRNLLRSARGGPQFRGVPALQLKLPPPLGTPKDRNEPFSKKPNPIAGSTLPAPGPTAPAANHGHAQDLAQKPAIGADGGLARNAIGVVIEQRAVVPHAGAPLGVHPLPGAMSTAMHASGEHGAATTAAGAPLAASNAKPSDAGLSTGAANQWQAGHPDRALQASHVAPIGGPAINGTGMSRPASSTGAVGGPARVAAGVLNGSNFRTKYP
jgi:hypothetical protein